MPIVIEGVEETSLNTAGTSHPVTLPAGGAASDLFLIIMDIGSTSATLNALTGWTESLDENVANGLKIIRYTGSGVPSNPTFTSSANTRSAQMAYRLSGVDKSVAPQIGTTATGTSTAPNPPSVTPSGGTLEYLSIAFYGAAGEEADDDTWEDTPPTGWSPTPPRQKSCGTAGTNLGGLIAAAERLITTGSAIDPGVFDKDVSAAWRAQHIVLHPLSVATAPELQVSGLVIEMTYEVSAGDTLAGNAVFQPGHSWPTGIIHRKIQGNAVFTADLSWPTGKVNLRLSGNAAFLPVLSWPTGAVVPRSTLSGNAVFAADLAWPTGSTFSSQTLAGNAAFTPTLSWPTGVLVADQALVGNAAFLPGLSWPTGSATTIEAQTLAGNAVFAPVLSWPQGKLGIALSGFFTWELTLDWPDGDVFISNSYVLGDAVFAPTLDWPTGFTAPIQTLSGNAAFVPTLSWPQGTVDASQTLSGTPFTPALSWPLGDTIRAQFLTGLPYLVSLSWPTGLLVPDQILLGNLFTVSLSWPDGAIGPTAPGEFTGTSDARILDDGSSPPSLSTSGSELGLSNSGRTGGLANSGKTPSGL